MVTDDAAWRSASSIRWNSPYTSARDGSSRVVSQKLDDVAPAEVVRMPVEVPDTEEAVS